MDKHVEFLVKLRDCSQQLADTANEYIQTLAPLEVKEDKQQTGDEAAIFSVLNFEHENGLRIGVFEAAYKANNPLDKWSYAYGVLTNAKATIKDRYHHEGYLYSYWLYDGNKIYRQRLKPK